MPLYVFAGLGSVYCDSELQIDVASPHETIVALTSCRRPFKVWAADAAHELDAVALSYRQRRAFDARGTQHLSFRITPLHRQFRRLSMQPMLPLARDMFGDLDAGLAGLSRGELDFTQARRVFDEVVTRTASLLPGVPFRDARIAQLLKQLLADPARSLESLARETDLSPSRLSHLFATDVGMSLRSFQTWQRIAKAGQYLLQDKGASSLTDIAHRLGFADSSHFARAFHQFTGHTPSKARDSVALHVISGP